jgi:hypothetical protein
MTMHAAISCDEFDQGVDELAVGTLGEPERGILLDHAAGCPACEARLNWLAGLADRLLLLVPEVEPPAGFEAGAMARMGGATTDRPASGADGPANARNVGDARSTDAGAHTADHGSVTDRRRRALGRRSTGTTTNPYAGARPAAAGKWQKRSWRLLAVAAVVVAVLGAGIALGRTSKRSQPVAVARQGEIMTIAGADVGTAQVINTPQPHVLLSLKSPLPWGVLNCQLETAQGRRVTIGSWEYDDNQDGTWAMRIDRSLAGAILLRIVDQQGTVVATAMLA